MTPAQLLDAIAVAKDHPTLTRLAAQVSAAGVGGEERARLVECGRARRALLNLLAEWDERGEDLPAAFGGRGEP